MTYVRDVGQRVIVSKGVAAKLDVLCARIGVCRDKLLGEALMMYERELLLAQVDAALADRHERSKVDRVLAGFAGEFLDAHTVGLDSVE